MKEKNFVLNLEYVPGGEYSEPAEMVLRGKVFTHKKRVKGAADSIKNCVVIAIERQPLIDFYNTDPGLSYDPDDTPPLVEVYSSLVDFTDGYEGWDPNDIYCAVVVVQNEVTDGLIK